MFGVGNLVRVTPRACRLAVQKKSFMSAPPRIRVPFSEKVAHGVLITIATVSIPVWIMGHINDYKGPPEAEDDD